MFSVYAYEIRIDTNIRIDLWVSRKSCSCDIHSYIRRKLRNNIGQKDQQSDNQSPYRRNQYGCRHDILNRLRQMVDARLEEVNQAFKNRIDELQHEDSCDHQPENDGFFDRNVKIIHQDDDEGGSGQVKTKTLFVPYHVHKPAECVLETFE